MSEDAIRRRIKRGTLKADEEGGQLYVLLDVESTAQPTAEPYAELVEKLWDRVRYLEGVVDTGEERGGDMAERSERPSDARGFPIRERRSWWRGIRAKKRLARTEERRRSTAARPASKEPLPAAWVRMQVWWRDQGRCARCRSREKLWFDYIIPVSKGGGNTEDNIRLLCEDCKRRSS